MKTLLIPPTPYTLITASFGKILAASWSWRPGRRPGMDTPCHMKKRRFSSSLVLKYFVVLIRMWPPVHQNDQAIGVVICFSLNGMQGCWVISVNSRRPRIIMLPGLFRAVFFLQPGRGSLWSLIKICFLKDAHHKYGKTGIQPFTPWSWPHYNGIISKSDIYCRLRCHPDIQTSYGPDFLRMT